MGLHLVIFLTVVVLWCLSEFPSLGVLPFGGGEQLQSGEPLNAILPAQPLVAVHIAIHRSDGYNAMQVFRHSAVYGTQLLAMPTLRITTVLSRR